MNHLMCHCVLQMALVLHLVRAKQDAIFRIKTPGLSARTAAAIDIVTGKIAP
jgi:hypothetical protein